MDSMKDQSSRLATYNHRWSMISPVQPRDLAQAGLYYTGTGDSVQCAFCDGVLKYWEDGDIPMIEHQRHFPHCGFVQGFVVGSNSLDGSRPSQSHYEEFRIVPKYPQNGKDKARLDTFRNWPNVKAKSTSGLTKTVFSCTGTTSLPSTHNERAVFPQFEEFGQRLESFMINAKLRAAVNPRLLSAAGYFYESFTTAVRSFCCGKTLAPKNWNNQNMFTVHEEESPSCRYIKDLSNLFEAFGLIPDKDITRHQTQELFRQVTEQIVPGVRTRRLKSEYPIQDEGLRSRTMCKICHNDTLSVAFLPCGHLICCTGCSTSCRQCCVCCRQIWARMKVLFG